MIKFHEKLPDFFYLAVSGGRDSMTILDFLDNWNSNNFEVIHINHGTRYGDETEAWLRKMMPKEYPDRKFIVCEIMGGPDKNESLEAFWSRKRNGIFQSMSAPVVTAHHLNDAVEWWIYSCLKGNPSLMGSTNNNVIRPFITTKKESIEYWRVTQNVPFRDDPSNDDVDFTRNFIRNYMMDYVLRVNPGIFKTVRKKYLNKE